MTSVSPLASSTTERGAGAGEWAGRQTPWSNEAEQAVLGAMLLDQDAALKAAEILDDTMFYKESHRLLFRSMLSLTERGDVIDPVTLRDELSRRADLDRAGGMEYIAALIDVVPTAANVDYHAKIVRDNAVMRRLVEAATGIIQDIYEGHGTAGEVLDNAEHRVFQVAQFRRAEEFIRIKELIWPTMERIEQLQSGAGSVTGVPSGFVDLDRYTAGLQRSELSIIAARPSMGKTALALNIVQHAAIEHNTGVAFFSIEMSKDALVQRLLCSEGLVDAQRLRRGQLRDDDYPKLARAAGLLGTAPIWIDDSASLTPLAMRSKARRLKAEHDIALVIGLQPACFRAHRQRRQRRRIVNPDGGGAEQSRRARELGIIVVAQLATPQALSIDQAFRAQQPLHEGILRHFDRERRNRWERRSTRPRPPGPARCAPSSAR